MKNTFLFTVVLLIIFSANAQKTLDDILMKYNKNDVPYISVTKLHEIQSEGNIIILDSREKREFDVSHISTATFVGYTNFFIEEVSETIQNKDTQIVVYCTIGVRSEKIVEKLQKAGFTNINNLYGGICEWKNNDYLIVDSNNTETDMIHAYTKQWSKWFKKGTVVYE